MAEISIIIPLFNKEKHIQDTLKSVLGQTFEHFELIVVNDGSTDDSLAEAQKIEDGRIQIHTIQNQGVSHARNYGVEKAKAEHIAFLDADDVWKPNHLENLNLLLKRFPDCGMYATAYELCYGKHCIVSKYHKIPENWRGIVNDFFESSTINCIAHSSSVMIPKSVLQSFGGFNPLYDSGEDIDAWIRIALKHSVVFDNKVSVTINMSAENKVSQRSVHTRTHMDFDAFKEEAGHKTLNKYLDLNRFSMAIQYKLEGYEKEAGVYINKINPENLNKKQRFLLHQTSLTLRLLSKFKNNLRKYGFGLNAFG